MLPQVCLPATVRDVLTFNAAAAVSLRVVLDIAVQMTKDHHRIIA